MGYGTRVLLEDASFDVRRGEILVILGGSGSGKSSLMKNIIGLYQPMAGDILIDGNSIVKASPDEKALLQRKLGVMYQSGALFGSLNLLENVRFPLDQFTDLALAGKNLTARMILRQVEMGHAESLMPAELSGGMLKRAGIARAMALGCDILLLDEPSAGLDPITGANLDRTILSLRKNLGFTFVVVTHELQSIFAIADRAIMLDPVSRSIIAEGMPADLRDHSGDPRVRQFFNRRPDAGRHKEVGHGRDQTLLPARRVRGGMRHDPGRGALPAWRPQAVPADIHLRDLLQRVGRRARARGARALPRRAAGQVSEILTSAATYERDVPLDRRRDYIVVRVKVDLSGKEAGRMEQDAVELVKRGLRAQTQLAGITGQQYLALDFLDAAKHHPLEFQWIPKYTYIPSAPSRTGEIIANAQAFLASLNEVDIKALGRNLNTLIVDLDRKVNDVPVAELSAGVNDVLRNANATIRARRSHPRHGANRPCAAQDRRRRHQVR